MVKRPLKIILIALFLAFGNQTYCKDRVLFDIKSKHSEKVDLSPIKTGATLLLLQSDWAGIAEVGEDYSLWLKDSELKIVKGRILIKLRVELRTPALFRSGSLIKSENIEFSFKPVDKWEDITSASKAIKQELENVSEEILIEATLGGEEVVKVARKMVKK